MNGTNKITGGRSSSQISIYDYPEHLNPFYEDENHKRIRFWKIGSKNKKTGRSNSFSIDSLKEMWAFKSFKLKKRSSTLGINKTSESPPVLRRQVHPVYDTYSTVDSRIRHTVDVGLGENFQRNAGYRSSLQDVTKDRNDIGLYRNDRYRSTMQNGYQTIDTPQRNRYVYGGSVSPTPASRYLTMTHGSSQTSLNSTNPFDEDDTISQTESMGPSPVRRSGRKKRRAPPPPSASSTPSKVDIHQEPTIEEVRESSSPEDNKNELLEISNLTACIESFVKTADTDSEQITSTIYEPKPVQSECLNKETEKIVIKSNDEEISIKTENKIEISKKSVDVKRPEIVTIENSRQSPENNDEYPERTSVSPEKETPIKISKSYSEKQLNTGTGQSTPIPPRIIIRMATEEDEILKNETVSDEKTKNYTIDQVSNDIDVKCESIEIIKKIESEKSDKSEVVTDELKITETSDTDSSYTVPIHNIESDRYKIRFIALKNGSPQAPRRDIDKTPIKMEENVSKTEQKPPQRRRTVKDIIASINKSQSLLKINHDSNYNKKDVETSTQAVVSEHKNESNANLNEMISEMERRDQHDDYCNDIPIMVERFDELNNNKSEIFKKCNVKCRSSNGSVSNNESTTRSSIDWNPVPKPRRSKATLNDNVK